MRIKKNLTEICKNTNCAEKVILSAFDSVFLRIYLAVKKIKSRKSAVEHTAKFMSTIDPEQDCAGAIYEEDENTETILYTSHRGNVYRINHHKHTDSLSYLEYEEDSCLADFFQSAKCPHK